METSNAPPDPTVAQAKQNVARLDKQAQALRAVLVQLLQDVVVAERRLGQGQGALLREANEQLLLAALDAQDLQDAIRAAQARQRQFLNGIANEVNNPMAPIRLAAAQLGLAGGHDALLPRAQALIAQQSAHMSRLVGDMLDMVNGHTGRLRFRRAPLDLVATLAAAASATQPAMDARRQRLRVRVPLPAAALTVHGHAAHLLQVVENLLDNASQYTPEGGNIELTATAVDGWAEVTVVDDGLGMSAQGLMHAFLPFAQDPHARGLHGLGIGLAVVKELVHAHGGTVAASSAGHNKGCQFVVRLPLFKAVKAAMAGG